MREIICAGGAQ